MGYYIRVLGKKDVDVPVKSIEAAFEEKQIPPTISIHCKEFDPWNELILTHSDGTPICQVERNRVEPGELGAKEIEEFLAELDTAKPASAARWLKQFLAKVKVVYAIRILSGSELSFGWDAIGAVSETILQHTGGIMQADGEGFSNEEGNHILWQFSENITGKWWMAVLNETGEWTKFQMDLGDRGHRSAFLAGEVPEGVVRGG